MKCRICNSTLDPTGTCPNCGFDEGLAYEDYPTLQSIEELSISGYRNKWETGSLAQEVNLLSRSVPPTPLP